MLEFTNIFFKSLINEFIYGGYYTALIAPLNVIFISILLNISINPPLLLIAFLPPLIIYSYNYYGEMADDVRSNPERAGFLKKKAKFYPFTISIYVISLTLLLFCYANTALIIFTLLLNFSGILYTLFFKSITQVILCFKNLFVALVWASWGPFSLLFFYSLSISRFFILVFLFLWSQFFLNSIFFDLKDIESDRGRGLKTLPVMWGNEPTLKFLYIANILSFIPIIIGVYLNIFPAFASSVLALLFYKFYYLKKAESADGKGLRAISYIIVDAETFLLPILLITGYLVIGIM